MFGLFAGFFLSAADPKDFALEEINGIWKEMWKSSSPDVKEPVTQKITGEMARKKLMGTWVVQYGVGPQKLIISLRSNHTVETSGTTDAGPWKRQGSWKIMSGKLILFFKEDSFPP
ncbi:MAG TPA: hypothetical protein VHH73_16000, partial [Verrucomicrobiae bacterium]|nr:hypothetical protein [Verrucomicrobiae bacterium]